MEPFQLPENFDTLNVDELQALLDAGLDAFQALGITVDSDEDLLVEGERIGALIAQVNEAKTARTVEAEKRAERARALIEQHTPVEPEPEPEPEPEAPVTPDAVISPEGVETPQPVAAAASPARRAAANAAPQVPVKARPQAKAMLTAAADVPGFPTGASLDGLDAVVAAVLARCKGLPNTRIGGRDGVRQHYGAATISFDGYGDLSQKATQDDYSLVWAAGNEARLPGGSLIAAGGWCAPSTTLYDMCQYESIDGILDTPEFSVTRGGIRWTTGPDFSDIYENCGFFLTEAEAIAGTAEKTCCMVDCPPFEEIRMDAVGLCVKTPLLVQSQYPELVRRFMEGTLVAHAHKVNKYMIDAIEAAAGAPVVGGTDETVSRALNKLDLQAIGMRYQYRMSQTQTIEVVLPFWYKALIRIDWDMQQWPREASEAAIAKWFSDRNLAPQWVYDWQDLVVDRCQVTLPDTVNVLMYPAGTWVKGTADVINVNAVYDSTSLESNVYTALFMEEGILAVQKCTHTCNIELTACASGRVAAADIAACLELGTGGTGGVAATGATAGLPGSWTPSGSNAPATVADLQGGVPNAVVASPTTGWTTGQYVQTKTAGAAGRATWTGTGWVGGVAP